MTENFRYIFRHSFIKYLFPLLLLLDTKFFYELKVVTEDFIYFSGYFSQVATRSIAPFSCTQKLYRAGEEVIEDFQALLQVTKIFIQLGGRW